MLAEPGMICQLKDGINLVRTAENELYLIDQDGHRFVLKSKTPITVESVSDYFFYNAYRTKIVKLIGRGEYVKVKQVPR